MTRQPFKLVYLTTTTWFFIC